MVTTPTFTGGTMDTEVGSTMGTEAGLIMEDIMEGTAAVMVLATAGAPVANAVSSDAAACMW